MNPRYRLIIAVLFLLIIGATEADAQRWKLRRYEAHFGVGINHPFMDIGPSGYWLQTLSFQGIRPQAEFGANFKILENLTAGIDLNYMMFGGFDVEERMTVAKFTTHAFEHNARAEFYFLSGGRAFGMGLFNRRGMVNNYNTADIYVFAGVGGILSKSRARYTNGDLATNDIYFDNNLHYGVVFPMGAGLKYSLDAYWNLGFELGGRFTLTDDLDGYATPFSNYNDRYVTISFRAVYKLRNDRRNIPTFRRY